MKRYNYMVRLMSVENTIIFGEFFEAKNEKEALSMFVAYCNKIGIEKCKYDTYDVISGEWVL